MRSIRLSASGATPIAIVIFSKRLRIVQNSRVCLEAATARQSRNTGGGSPPLNELDQISRAEWLDVESHSLRSEHRMFRGQTNHAGALFGFDPDRAHAAE